MESILNTIKENLGISEDTHAFDQDVLTCINSVIFTLNQLGIGQPRFMVLGEEETWSDFMGDSDLTGAVRQYVHLKTRLLFDPPDHGFVVQAYQDAIKELEWRMNEQVEGRCRDG